MKNEIRELSVEEIAEVSGGNPSATIDWLIAEGEVSSEIAYIAQMNRVNSTLSYDYYA